MQNTPHTHRLLGSVNGRAIEVPLQSGMSYTFSEDPSADVVLAGRGGSSNYALFQDDATKEWILMAVSGEITTDSGVKKSISVSDDCEISLGGSTVNLRIETIEAPEDLLAASLESDDVEIGEPTPANKKSYSSPLRLLALVAILAASLLFVLFGQKNKTPEKTNYSSTVMSPNEDAVASESQQSSSGTNSLSATDASASLFDDHSKAHDYYQGALIQYDYGNFDEAIALIRRAVVTDPSNARFKELSSDWEQKLSEELARLYNRACIDSQYLRHFEATQAFRAIVESEVDRSSVRYQESVRMLDKLEVGDDTQSVQCGHS